MSHQTKMFAVPSKPSATRAETRARRDKARKWAKDKGYPTYNDSRFCYDDCTGFNTGHATGGAIVPLHCTREPKPLCWDCIPYPGAPLRNHESHSTGLLSNVCARCLRVGDDDIFGIGGVHQRGGPFCWDCGTPDKAVYEAWLLALRDDPGLVPPWRGDKSVRP